MLINPHTGLSNHQKHKPMHIPFHSNQAKSLCHHVTVAAIETPSIRLYRVYCVSASDALMYMCPYREAYARSQYLRALSPPSCHTSLATRKIFRINQTNFDGARVAAEMRRIRGGVVCVYVCGLKVIKNSTRQVAPRRVLKGNT